MPFTGKPTTATSYNRLMSTTACAVFDLGSCSTVSDQLATAVLVCSDRRQGPLWCQPPPPITRPRRHRLKLRLCTSLLADMFTVRLEPPSPPSDPSPMRTSVSFCLSKPQKLNPHAVPMLVEPFPTGHRLAGFGRENTGDTMERGSYALAVGPKGQSGTSHFFAGGPSSCRCSPKQQYSLVFSI
jgi:hypothetical protein